MAHSRYTRWSQKHMIQWWCMRPGLSPANAYLALIKTPHMSEAVHQLSDGYRRRGRFGRRSRVSNIKQRLDNGLQWVTKRHGRWNIVG